MFRHLPSRDRQCTKGNSFERPMGKWNLPGTELWRGDCTEVKNGKANELGQSHSGRREGRFMKASAMCPQ
jgi:hypothetical protein